MNALKNKFSNSKNLLCIWHIEKNIFSKCKEYFATENDWIEFLQDWNFVVKSRSVNGYESAWGKLTLKYHHQEKVINYIENTWLPFKEMFVSAWSDNYLHLGCKASSRVEGAHSLMKKYLQASTGNLKIVHERICSMIDQQISEYQTKMATELTTIPLSVNSTIFGLIFNKVSHFAIRKIHEEYVKFKKATPDNPLGPCPCTMISTMGLPCKHVLETMEQNGELITLESIHEHWHLKRKTSVPNSELNVTNSIETLLQKFKNNYDSWTSWEQTAARKQISVLIDGPTLPILDPLVPVTRGWPIYIFL